MGEQPHSPLGHSRNQPRSEGLGCAPTSSHQPLVEDSSWKVEGVHSNLPRGWQSGSGASPQAKGCRCSWAGLHGEVRYLQRPPHDSLICDLRSRQ